MGNLKSWAGPLKSGASVYVSGVVAWPLDILIGQAGGHGNIGGGMVVLSKSAVEPIWPGHRLE